MKKEKIDSKITILSDSHGRGLAEMVNNRCSGATEVFGFVNPGATLQQVCSSLQPERYSEKDQVVLIASDKCFRKLDFNSELFKEQKYNCLYFALQVRL